MFLNCLTFPGRVVLFIQQLHHIGKEVISVKKLFTILSALVLAFAFGAAFADEIPTIDKAAKKELGSKIFEDSLVVYGTEMGGESVKGAAAGGLGAEKAVKSDFDARRHLGPGGSDLP